MIFFYTVTIIVNFGKKLPVEPGNHNSKLGQKSIANISVIRKVRSNGRFVTFGSNEIPVL